MLESISRVKRQPLPPVFKGGFGVGPVVCTKAHLRGDDRKANGSLAKVSVALANCPVIFLFQNDIVKASGAYVRQAQENVF